MAPPLGGSEHRIFLVAPARLASGYTSWRIKADAAVTCAARVKLKARSLSCRVWAASAVGVAVLHPCPDHDAQMSPSVSPSAAQKMH